jgi:hypothetical protein
MSALHACNPPHPHLAKTIEDRNGGRAAPTFSRSRASLVPATSIHVWRSMASDAHGSSGAWQGGLSGEPSKRRIVLSAAALVVGFRFGRKTPGIARQSVR